MSASGEFLIAKTMDFSVRVVKLYKWLCEEKREFVMSKQLLRAATSIGANLSEAQGAISRPDFSSKVYICSKECWEVQYWIDLLYKTEFLTERQYQSIKNDAVEIGKILTSMTKKLQPDGHH